MTNLEAGLRRFARFWRYPVYEARNKTVGFVGALRNAYLQRSEIRRLQVALAGSDWRGRVLVVIPTYRRPEGLQRALQSALSQTFKDVVVVVVDDGGGDLPTINSDARVLVVSLSSNCGTLGVVRNIGVALARSEFIAYLDDDNIWTPNHLQTAVSALESAQALGVVYTSVQRLRPDGSELDVLVEPFLRRKLGGKNFVDSNSIVVRRSCHVEFSKVPRNKTTVPKEDWEYIWRLSRNHRVKHIPEVTVRYLVNPDSYYTSWTPTQIGVEQSE